MRLKAELKAKEEAIVRKEEPSKKASELQKERLQTRRQNQRATREEAAGGLLKRKPSVGGDAEAVEVKREKCDEAEETRE